VWGSSYSLCSNSGENFLHPAFFSFLPHAVISPCHCNIPPFFHIESPVYYSNFYSFWAAHLLPSWTPPTPPLIFHGPGFFLFFQPPVSFLRCIYRCVGIKHFLTCSLFFAPLPSRHFFDPCPPAAWAAPIESWTFSRGET